MAKNFPAPLEAHPPESLPCFPLMHKSWRIFQRHARFLLKLTFGLLAPILALALLIGSLSRDTPQQAKNGPPKLTPVSTVLVLLYILMSMTAGLVQTAVFVHVVIGDHLGKPPGKLWLAVKRSFWRLVGTNLAKQAVVVPVAFVGGIALTIVVVLFVGISADTSEPTPSLVIGVSLGLLLFAVLLVAIAVHLAFADTATVVEGPRVWGLLAVSRSWDLCRGSRSTICAVGLLHMLGALLLTVLHSLLLVLVVHTQGSLSAITALGVVVESVISTGAILVIQAYFQVVWIVLYLSARKKTETDFGLGTLSLYFDEDLKSPSEYLMVGVEDRV